MLRAQPLVGLVTGRSADGSANVGAAFRKGFNETGYVEGQNVVVEYHWLAGQYDRVPALMADLVRRHVAVIVNPASVSNTESTLREVQEAAPALGLNIEILNATTIGEIDAAFAALARERPDALFVGLDGFFTSRRMQFATLAAVNKIPATYSNREYVEAGGLMSYGTDLTDVFHQVGVYTGNILKGAKPADLPVVQSTKLEFVLNLQTARALGLSVPPSLLSIADEVIE